MRGFGNYINDVWSQTWAISGIITVVIFAMGVATTPRAAVSNAGSKAPLANRIDDVVNVKEGAVKATQDAQIASGYNVDEFTEVTLKEGSIVYGGTPGQTAWYTDFNSVKSSGLDRTTLFKGLQVNPNPNLGYRPQVTAYRVTRMLR